MKTIFEKVAGFDVEKHQKTELCVEHTGRKKAKEPERKRSEVESKR